MADIEALQKADAADHNASLELWRLPSGVWDQIVLMLRPHHRLQLRGVCRKFREVVNNNTSRIRVSGVEVWLGRLHAWVSPS